MVVRVIKPKFVRKDRDKTDTRVLVGSTPALPIERGVAGPGMLADTIVRRWQDHLPLHRLEGIYARDGLELARSTMGTWHEALANLAERWAYLRDIFCLLREWPRHALLDLAPCNWAQSSARDDVKAKLDADPYRAITLGRE